MRYLRVKNLEKYQPQSAKRLPWIKLMTELLEPTRQPWYTELPDATKALLHHIWLMAAVLGGRIPEDWITRERLNLKSRPSLDSILNLGLVWFENEDGNLSEPSHARLARSGTLPSGSLASEDRESEFSPDLAFAALWADYPRRIGRKEAHRHFVATVKTPEDFARIRAALARYKAEVAGRPMQYVKHGAAWFNQWADWLDAPLATISAFSHTEPPQAVTSDDLRELDWMVRKGEWNRTDCTREQARDYLAYIAANHDGDLTDAPTLADFLRSQSSEVPV